MTAMDLATLVDLDGLAVSPDGRWVAFQVRQADPRTNAYAQEWRVAATDGASSRRIAGAGDPIQVESFGRIGGFVLAPPPVWSPDSQWIAYLRRDNGRTQVWRARVDGGLAEQLTHDASDARALVFSPDGTRLLYQTQPGTAQIAAALAQEGREGFHYDRRFLPYHSTKPTQPADLDFSAVRATSGVRQFTAEEQSQHRTFVYDFASRRVHPAIAGEAAEFASLVGGPQPQGREHYRYNAAASPVGALAWTEALDPQRQGVLPPLTVVAQLHSNAEPTVCGAAECTSQTLRGLWWRDENEIIFARLEGAALSDTALYAWRAGDAAARLVLRTPNRFTALGEWNCSVGGDRLVCFYEEPARPRRLVAIDLDSGAVDTLYDPNPGFVRFNLGPAPQRLEFRSPSGVIAYGYLVLPPRRRAGQRLSLVIVTYRCDEFLRGGTGDEYPVFPLAAESHAVLCFSIPNLDYERLAALDAAAYRRWGHGEGDPLRQRVQEGLETAVAQLDHMGVIDPRRVGVTGLSNGAATVMYALFHPPQLAAAVASGPDDGPSGTFLTGPAGREALSRQGLGSALSPRWNALSIVRNAASVRAPLLLNVADHEMLGTLEVITALEDAGRAVEMYVFPDEYHVKLHPAHRLAIYRRNIDWMNFWLRGVEDSDPAKTAQYERWRVMRVKQCERLKGEGAPWYCRQDPDQSSSQ